jgi:hypothetical protein
MKTAWELRRRVTRLTSQVALRGAAFTRHALRLARSARTSNATMLKLQARNREKFAVEAVPTSLGNSFYATAGDRDTQLSHCNVANLPVGTSIGRNRSKISKREEVIAEATGPEPLRFPRAAPRGLFEAAAAGDCTSTFNFKSLDELSFDLEATLQHVKIDTNTVKEGATGNDKLLSECIESPSEVELCISILTETASLLRDISRNRPDLLPRELLDDLQQVNRKIVKRLSNSLSEERAWRRNQVLH